MDTFINLSNSALWALAVGFFSPPVISVIQQSRWSARVQSLVAFAFYIAVAAITAWFAGLFSIGDIGRLGLLIFLAASVSYKSLWKPTGVSPAIEAATSPKNDDGPKHSTDSSPATHVLINADSYQDPGSIAQATKRKTNGLQL